MALRARGVHIDTFSVRETAPDQLLTEIDRAEHARTFAILPARLPEILRAQLHAFRRAPRRYLATLVHSLKAGAVSPRSALWRLFYFVEATILHRELSARGLRHIHAHFSNVGADIAELVVHYADRPDDRWTWSLTVHGPTEFYSVERSRLREKIASAARIVCISDFAKSQLLRSSDRDDWSKLSVVHCGIDPERFDAPVRTGVPGHLNALFVGRLVDDKAPEFAVRAIDEARRSRRDVRLTVVGDGPARPRLEALVRNLGLDSDIVTFVGAVGQDEIPGYIERCDAFCLPSFAEGVPIVLMEAMAMRRPVVTTAIMGIPELVEDGVNGLLVRPARADSLAAALVALADDPALRERLGEAGRDTVIRNFEISRSAQQLEELFVGLEGAESGAASGSFNEDPLAIDGSVEQRLAL